MLHNVPKMPWIPTEFLKTTHNVLWNFEKYNLYFFQTFLTFLHSISNQRWKEAKKNNQKSIVTPEVQILYGGLLGPWEWHYSQQFLKLSISGGGRKATVQSIPHWLPSRSAVRNPGLSAGPEKSGVPFGHSPYYPLSPSQKLRASVVGVGWISRESFEWPFRALMFRGQGSFKGVYLEAKTHPLQLWLKHSILLRMTLRLIINQKVLLAGNK